MRKIKHLSKYRFFIIIAIINLFRIDQWKECNIKTLKSKRSFWKDFSDLALTVIDATQGVDQKHGFLASLTLYQMNLIIPTMNI